MNCYRHPDVPAVGICKSCNKGVCMNCLTDVGDGIACTETCTDEVRKINNMINSGKRRSSYTGVLYLVAGSLMVAVNVLIMKRTDPFILGFGITLMLFGLYHLITQQIKSGKKPLDQF